MTIRGNGVVIEAVTESPVELFPGAYTVAVDQPWGGTANAANQCALGIRFDGDLDQRAGSAATVDRRLSSAGPPARSGRRCQLVMVPAVFDLDT